MYAKTCIPFGIYNIEISISPKFKRELLRVKDVSEFVGVLFHAGNRPEDTEGCILLGENKIKGQVINSRKYERMLVTLCKTAIKEGKKIELEIVSG